MKNEDLYDEQFSSRQVFFYGQNKLLGVPLIQILHKSIKKKGEPLFYTIMQDIIALTEGEIDSLTLQDKGES